VTSIARWYTPLASTLVVDDVDAGLAAEVEALGIGCVVTPTVMTTPAAAADLARRCMEVVIG
jgi:hypothetical protein